MTIDDCEGCSSKQYMDTEYKNYTVCGLLYKYNEELKVIKDIPMCPCVNCIVKVICRDGCKEYSDYTTEVKKDINFFNDL